MEFSYTDEKGVAQMEQWEAFTDALNCNYLYCKQSKSTAYYVNDGTMFYFTTFYGNKNSLLYYFYLTAFKVLLGYHKDLAVTDVLPLSTIRNKNWMVWLYDFIAPFTNRLVVNYTVKQHGSDNLFQPQTLTLLSRIESSFFGKIQGESHGSILLNNNRIEKFSFSQKKIKIEAKCTNI